MPPACQSRVACPRMALARWKDLCLDVADLSVAAGFWAPALGATVQRPPDDEIGWHVCADPEGNEFCVFAPRDDKPRGLYELVVDTAVPAAQAAWWAGVLGATAANDAGQPW